jgi:hypothetical protein
VSGGSRLSPSAVALIAAAACAVPAAAAPRAPATPTGIPHDCSRDVTRALTAWIASVRDGSVVAFANRGCYRIEGTLELRKRSNLDFEGNGAIFRSFDRPSDHRALWRIVDSRDITLHDMTIRGSYTKGGTFTAALQHAHAVDVDGSSVELGGLTMTNVAGDCVYFGRGATKALTLSSGFVHDSVCSRTSRNAIAVVAGENILVQRVTTSAIGYNVFDVEPNLDSGWGSTGVTFDDNTIHSYARNAYSIVESAPIDNQAFTNNRVVGQGLKIGIGDPANAHYRATNVTITGNVAAVPQAPAAINIVNVDGLTMTRNTVAMTGGPMASVVGSCGLRIAGNRYPGGTTAALINPSICSFAPAHGRAGETVTVNGAGFNEASLVTVSGAPAPFKLSSDAQLTFTVPRDARTGVISVTTPNGTVISLVQFTVVDDEGG